MTKSETLLLRMRNGEAMSTAQSMKMIGLLSVPAILAQISSIIMQYIDASMVGHLGTNESAAIGLVSSTTWLFGGLTMAAGTGFSVTVAKKIGAKNEKGARKTVRMGLACATAVSLVLLVIGVLLSFVLPRALGADKEIEFDARQYFLIFALSLPVMQLNSAAAGMLQAGGNMRTPGALEAIMCALDVIFNAVLIFPSRAVKFLGVSVTIPGANLGVTGAALGTALAEFVTAIIMLYALLKRDEKLSLKAGEKWEFDLSELKTAAKIAFPMAVEQFVSCSSYIAFTRIVSPLGGVAIAAHSFSVTAESLCYMPGYGIGSAASTVIGQSIGAGRVDLTRKLGRLSVALGAALMAATGAFMFFASPGMIGLLSPDETIKELGTAVLRIEAFAEPLYGASIVATGVFRGAGDTVVPTVLNLISMWAVRIPMAAILAARYGLKGAWIAMAIELCVRGLLFIALLASRFKNRAENGRY